MRQSYAPMADNPFLPAMNPQSNGSRHLYHIDLSVEKYRRKGGKRMIQRLNEERDRQKTLYLAHGADASKADRA